MSEPECPHEWKDFPFKEGAPLPEAITNAVHALAGIGAGWNLKHCVRCWVMKLEAWPQTRTMVDARCKVRPEKS